MQIRILLFAAFREAVGASQLALNVPESTTAEAAFLELATRHAGLAALRPYTTFAVNREVVGEDTVLQDGDELAFLQPVSGGG